ncbi:MAG TPA: hypothetical protein VKM55_10620 [Candidatus Lokiarchaeia archaeon]|nr:hypothetical protein [Candidatus Lokiarchaeia archaeon]
MDIAAILQDANIIDTTEQNRLEQDIKSRYPTKRTNPKSGKPPSDDCAIEYAFPYNLAGPNVFPYFQTSDNKQKLTIYEGACILGDGAMTSFSIAEIDEINVIYPDRSDFMDIDQFIYSIMDYPDLVPLRSRLQELLRQPVKLDMVFV